MVRIYDCFENWCRSNDMLINDTKTVVCFLHRKKYPSSNEFRLAQFITHKFRALGFIIDDKLNFVNHSRMVIEWLNKRTTVIKRLRTQLNLSQQVLLRIAQSFRTKIFFSTWYLLTLSKHQRAALQLAFGKMVRQALGLIKLVPVEQAHKLCGLSSFEDYEKYWFCIRSFEANILGKVDLFSEYRNLKDSLISLPDRSRNLRESTQKVRLKGEMDRKLSRFPVRIGELVDFVFSYREKLENWYFGGNGMRNGSHKINLKREILEPLISKDTDISEEIKKLNEEYFKKFN